MVFRDFGVMVGSCGSSGTVYTCKDEKYLRKVKQKMSLGISKAKAWIISSPFKRWGTDTQPKPYRRIHGAGRWKVDSLGSRPGSQWLCQTFSLVMKDSHSITADCMGVSGRKLVPPWMPFPAFHRLYRVSWASSIYSQTHSWKFNKAKGVGQSTKKPLCAI